MKFKIYLVLLSLLYLTILVLASTLIVNNNICIANKKFELWFSALFLSIFINLTAIIVCWNYQKLSLKTPSFLSLILGSILLLIPLSGIFDLSRKCNVSLKYLGSAIGATIAAFFISLVLFIKMRKVKQNLFEKRTSMARIGKSVGLKTLYPKTALDEEKQRAYYASLEEPSSYNDSASYNRLGFNNINAEDENVPWGGSYFLQDVINAKKSLGKKLLGISDDDLNRVGYQPVSDNWIGEDIEFNNLPDNSEEEFYEFNLPDNSEEEFYDAIDN